MQRSFSRQRVVYGAFFLSIISLFSLVSFAAANTAFWVSDEIFQGVTVDHVELGGLSKQAARHKLEAVWSDSTLPQGIILVSGDKSIVVSLEEIDFSISIDQIIDEAYAVGRKGSFLQQLQDRYLANNYGKEVLLAAKFNQNKLQLAVQKAAEAMNQEPKNATVIMQNSEVRIVPEKTGQKIDVDKTVNMVEEELQKHRYVTTALVCDTLTPAILATDLQSIDGILASYQTEFNSSDWGRSQNVLLAAAKINGILVKPDSIFSFNDAVGSRLAELGFQEAPVFVEGKLVPDIGGGVCQVSSTLYNAILLADMTVVERSTHFSPPSYVPLGLDATVADNLLDFRFKNTSTTPIYITSEVNGNLLTITVFGKKNVMAPTIEIVSANKKILEPNVIVKQDASLPSGVEKVIEAGQRGYRISTYRIKKINEQEISRELLATDEFLPTDRVILVGTQSAGKTK